MELLLAELQIQAATVARAGQRVDAARSKTSQAQDGIRHTIADMTRVEEAQNTAATEADETRLASEMERLKGGLSAINKLEQISRKPKPCFGRRKMRMMPLKIN
jgi:hypothetical protein